MTQAYPLLWPMGMPRTRDPDSSRFKTELTTSINNVMRELQRFANDSEKAVQNIVVSANVTLMDQNPDDGGIAVYFRWDNMDCCIAVDKYQKPKENLQAVAHIVEAERTKLRHGGMNIVRASFRGFTALPPPTGASGKLAKPWRDVLGVPKGCKDIDDCEVRYRILVKETHPDRPGGDVVKFNAVADAIRQAREELS